MKLLTLQANSIQLELTQAFRHVLAALPSLALVSLDGYLGGKASERIPCDWRLFIPCAVADSLLKAISEAARNAASGGVVLVHLLRGFLREHHEAKQTKLNPNLNPKALPRP